MASLYATKASNLAICAFVLSRQTKRIIVKRVIQRLVESCGFSLGAPVFSHKEYLQGSLDFKKMTDPQKAF